VAWAVDGAPSGTLTLSGSGDVSWNWMPATSGSHVISATFTSSDGYPAESYSMTIDIPS